MDGYVIVRILKPRRRKMHISVAKKIFENVSGTCFVGLDTTIVVNRLVRDQKVQPGVHTKETTGSLVMVFAQKDPTAFNVQVLRQMEKEGLNPDDFEAGEMSYGHWMPKTVFIEHTKKGDTEPTHYLRVHFVRNGKSKHFLDGVPVDLNDIVDTSAPPTPSKQDKLGIKDKVIPRNYKLASIDRIRIDGTEYVV